MYYYKRTENSLWTVMIDTDSGTVPESDHDSREDAAQRVAYLNGNSQELTIVGLQEIVLQLTRIADILEGDAEFRWQPRYGK